MDSEDALSNVIRSAKALDLKEGEVETLEETEAITNLVIPEVLDLIKDQKMRGEVRRLREAHLRQNSHRWTNVAELTADLFARSSGAKRVRAYHEMEKYVAELDFPQIESIGERDVRDAIMAIKLIHTKTRERR
jgi:hypothetical protein